MTLQSELTVGAGKRVWIIDQYASWRSIATRQIKFCNILQSYGYDVTVICGSFVHKSNRDLLAKNEKFRYMEIEGAKYLVVKSKAYEGNGLGRILASLKFQKDVMKVTKKMPKPDIVISDYVGLFGNKFLKFKTKYGAKLITDVLDLWPETFVDMGYIKRKSLIAKILYKMEHKAYSVADYCMFSFEGGADYFIEKGWDTGHGGDLNVDKVLYINNGVDLEEYNMLQKENILEDADLDCNKFKAVYLGSISEANNASLLVDTAIELNKTDDDIVILVYGDGSQREELERLCKQHELKNIKFKGRLDIKYAPNVLSRGDLNLFNFADIALLRFGCSPNKLFMYLASGKPVLSSVKPNYDIVAGKQCGIVTGNNAKAFAEGIVKFKNMEKQDYLQYCERCKDIAKQFDYRYMIETVLLPVLREV